MLPVTRVHGPGATEKMSISMITDRLCGNGRFANVYKATLTYPVSRLIAVKNVWNEKNYPTHPEITLLSQLCHPNIVELLYYYRRLIEGKTVHCLVLNFMSDDMAKLRERGVRFDDIDACLYSYQLFAAVAYLACKSILHLDIKPANILVDHPTGRLQLADFGNAQKLVREGEQEQSYQVTRYYRPPEVVFSTKIFTTAVDVWSAACCMAEFILGRILFKGRSTVDQMKLLLDIFGYPSENDIKAMRIARPRTAKPTARGLDKYTAGELSTEAKEVLEAVFVHNPRRRASAAECLTKQYFTRLQHIEKRLNGGKLPELVGMKKEKESDSEESDD